MSTSIIKQGYLVKRGGGFKNWKRRWFVLTNQELSYFKEEGDSKPQGVIQVGTIGKNSSVAVAESTNEERTHVFEVYTPGRTYYFAATSKTEKEEWMTTLQTLVTDQKTNSKSTTVKSTSTTSTSSTSKGNSSNTSTTSTSTSNTETTITSSMTSFASYDDDDDDDDEGGIVGITYQGYLTKKGQTRKNWKRRWFVLKGCLLSYWESDKEFTTDEPLGVIDVTMATDIKESDNDERTHMIEILLPKRTYYMSAISSEDKQNWLDALNDARKRSGSTDIIIDRLKTSLVRRDSVGSVGSDRKSGWTEERMLCVEASCAQVYSLYADTQSWSEWDPDIARAGLKSGHKFANGAIVDATMTDGKEYECELTAVVPGHSFAYMVDIPGSTMVCTFIAYNLPALVEEAKKSKVLAAKFEKHLDTEDGKFQSLLVHTFKFSGRMGSIYGVGFKNSVEHGLEEGLENIRTMAQKVEIE